MLKELLVVVCDESMRLQLQLGTVLQRTAAVLLGSRLNMATRR